MIDLADRPARDLHAALRAGRVTPAAVAEACLDRVGTREGKVHAFTVLDADGWRRAAASAAGDTVLAGLPIGVKDVLDVGGLPAGYGSPIWDGHVPRADSAAVAMARAAGGVVAGKTVTTEFATRRAGPTTNPHDPARTPGGSSQGSAAGVAAGFFPLAFGTQTAGSVIRPAAFCGVAGFKPSFGLIHRGGMRVMSETLDTVGTMARDVFGCALLAGTAAGVDLTRGLGERRGPPRVGVVGSPARGELEPAVIAVLEAAAARLARVGAHLTVVSLPPAVLVAVGAHPVVMQAETRHALAWERATAPDRLSEHLMERAAWAAGLPEDALPTARGTLATARDAFSGVMADLDVILTASAPGEAPVGLDSTGDPACNLLWTALHAPCVTVPADFGPNGMPIGVQIIGAVGADAATLAVAEWVEATLR